ncbi:MAG: glycosyltransferase family 39 protein [Acidobacteria bacterium]|nr:glycosyltransferase family 39 protein [Acidobacteriota bacterium]
MGSLRAFRPVLVFFFLALGLVAALQYKSGAYRTEFGSSSDESAHYVTGLMVRDYVAGLFPSAPMPFAENYYLHYPKVALGQWPPFFYVVQAAWTLLFSASRVSVVLLMAAIAATLAALLFAVLRKEFGWVTGVAGGMFFAALPLTQRISRQVMSEILVALLVFLSMLAYGRYLDRQRWQDAVWFGVLASLAILTKGTATILGLAPPLAVVLSRQFGLLRRWSFWAPAVIVVASCAPWYLWVPGAKHEGVGTEGGMFWIDSVKFLQTFEWWARSVGTPAACLAAVGFLERLYRTLKGGSDRPSGFWAVAGAVLLSTIVGRVTLMAWGYRHTMTNIPMLILFAAAGLWWILQPGPWRKLDRRVQLAVVAVLAAIPFTLNLWAVGPKDYHGFSEAAEQLLAQPQFRNSAFLIASEGVGEGAFIAEVAMREKRPGHFVLRANKVLSSSDWMGNFFEQHFKNAAEMMRFLEETPVGIVVLDPVADPMFEHQRTLKAVLEQYRERWELLGTYPRSRRRSGDLPAIQVYRLVGHEGKPVGKIKLFLRGRTVED